MKPRVGFCLIGVLLSGCASIPGTAPSGAPNDVAWQRRHARLMQLQDWDMQGRVAVTNGKDGGSGSMEWRQQGGVFQFDFHGPFGAGALTIHGTPDALHVKTSRGDDFISTDPEHDFARLMHVPLPVLEMRYWVIGVPAPAAPSSRRVDAQGQIVNMVQAGWQVRYLSYAGFDGYAMPTRIVIERGAVRIKLAIEHWQLDAPASGERAPAP